MAKPMCPTPAWTAWSTLTVCNVSRLWPQPHNQGEITGKPHPYRLLWRHNGHDGVSNHQPHDCLLNRLIRRRSKKTSNLRVNGLCAGNSRVAGEFPAQKASNAENVSFWYLHNLTDLFAETHRYHCSSNAAISPKMRCIALMAGVTSARGIQNMQYTVSSTTHLNCLSDITNALIQYGVVVLS